LIQLRRRKPYNPEIVALENLLADYGQKQSLLFGQFREIWMGMALPEFRAGLSAMISRTAIKSSNGGGQQNQ
jgi:hypothetical protein